MALKFNANNFPIMDPEEYREPDWNERIVNPMMQGLGMIIQNEQHENDQKRQNALLAMAQEEHARKWKTSLRSMMGGGQQSNTMTTPLFRQPRMQSSDPMAQTSLQPKPLFNSQANPYDAYLDAQGSEGRAEYVNYLKALSEANKNQRGLNADYLTPEVAKAIKNGDLDSLAKYYPGGIPKELMSSIFSGERLKNLESERDERQDERTKARYRNYLNDMKQRDPQIKELHKQDLSLSAIDSLSQLVKEGNTVAFSALGPKMARGMGDVGVLTDADVVRYVRSGMITQKAGDVILTWLHGQPTQATLNEIGDITKAMRTAFQSKIQPKYDEYIRSFAQFEGISPEQMAVNLGLSYGGGQMDGMMGLPDATPGRTDPLDVLGGF